MQAMVGNAVRVVVVALLCIVGAKTEKCPDTLGGFSAWIVPNCLDTLGFSMHLCQLPRILQSCLDSLGPTASEPVATGHCLRGHRATRCEDNDANGAEHRVRQHDWLCVALLGRTETLSEREKHDGCVPLE